MTYSGKCTGCGSCVSVCFANAREISGKIVSVQQALEKVLGDKLFYDGSGGGMTISGGEPLAHPEFSANLLAACKRAGIHTAVETCCDATREVIGKVFAHVDLGLIDVKCMDSYIHEKLTGKGNKQILENIRHIYHDLHVPIIVRVPVIPGYNDSDENISATAAFTAIELGPEVKIHLLPYHRLGVSKSESLGRTDSLILDPPDTKHMKHLLEIVVGYGIKAQIGG